MSFSLGWAGKNQVLIMEEAEERLRTWRRPAGGPQRIPMPRLGEPKPWGFFGESVMKKCFFYGENQFFLEKDEQMVLLQ